MRAWFIVESDDEEVCCSDVNDYKNNVEYLELNSTAMEL